MHLLQKPEHCDQQPRWCNKTQQSPKILISKINYEKEKEGIRGSGILERRPRVKFGSSPSIQDFLSDMTLGKDIEML